MPFTKTLLAIIFTTALVACASGPSNLTREEIASLSTVELCDFYRQEQTIPIHEELLNRGFTEGNLVNIKGGWVLTGMNEMTARCAWGQPSAVNTTRTEDSVHRQYVYRSRSRYLGTKYFYTEDGKVTATQR